MAFITVCMYTCVIFLRPAEILPALQGIPFFLIFSILSILTVALEQAQSPKLPQNKLLILFAFAVIISNITVGWFGGATGAAYRMSTNLVYYFCLIRTLSNRDRITKFIYLLFFLTIILSIHGVIQSKTGYGFGNITPLFDSREGGVMRIRYSGTLNDPNDLSLILVPFLTFAIIGIIYKKWPLIIKLFMIPAIALVAVNIRLTYSRGAIVGSLVLLALVIAIKKLSLKKMLQGIGVCIMLLMFAPAISGLLGTASFEEESAAGRVVAWEQGLIAFKYQPIFGIGYDRWYEIHKHAAHNTYVQVMTEEGVVGLFGFLGFIYFTIVQLTTVMKSPNLTKDDLYLIHAGFISLVVFLIMAFFLSRAYNLYIYLFVALNSAIASQYITEENSANFRFTNKHVRFISFLTIGFVIFVYLIVTLGLRG